MHCTKAITITGYVIRFVDLREPKPRTVQEEVYAMDKDALTALGVLGLNAADFITEKYRSGGYHVLGVERISARQTVTIDLYKLWSSEKSAAEKEAAQ